VEAQTGELAPGAQNADVLENLVGHGRLQHDQIVVVQQFPGPGAIQLGRGGRVGPHHLDRDALGVHRATGHRKVGSGRLRGVGQGAFEDERPGGQFDRDAGAFELGAERFGQQRFADLDLARPVARLLLVVGQIDQGVEQGLGLAGGLGVAVGEEDGPRLETHPACRPGTNRIGEPFLIRPDPEGQSRNPALPDLAGALGKASKPLCLEIDHRKSQV